MTLMKPFLTKKSKVPLGEGITRADVINMHILAKEKIRSLLVDQEKIPRELVFIGRNMNLVRANNKAMGSVVNRLEKLLICMYGHI